MSEKAIKAMEKRLTRLEEAVFGKKGSRAEKAGGSNFSGATGGVRLLVTKNFFDTKRTRSETRSALAKNGYHYSGPAVQMALNRLSKRTGFLAAFKEAGKKVYVRRK